MNAQCLVDLLLEVNVINVKDIDVELNKLAARLSDPRAQKWFKRVVRYFVINIDRLLKEPLVAKAEPRKMYHPPNVGGGEYGASKYYADPRGGWANTQEPEAIPAGKLGKPWGEKEFAGRPQDCQKCAGTGNLKTIRHFETGEEYETASNTRDTEAERRTWKPCPRCKGTGEHRWLESLLRRMLGELLGEQYDPKKQTYTTALHEPVVQKDIEQSFTPFKPAKAKTKSIIGEPPAKSELQPWMTDPGAEAKEFYHFDPIQVRRRELFGRLTNLVNFLNYQTKLAVHRMDFEPVAGEDPTEAKAKAVKKEKAAEAEALLQQLLTAKTDDIEAFRDVMAKAHSWGQNVKDKPWEFTNDGKTVATIDTLSLRRVMYPETAVAFSAGTRWETANPAEAERVLERNGDIWVVQKGGRPYVLVMFHGNYGEGSAKKVDGMEIDQQTAREIAPLFSDRNRFTEENLVQVASLAREVTIPDRSRLVLTLPGNWRLVQLTGPFDLAREGCVMNHCVKNKSYRDKIAAGTHNFFSLRDPDFRSVVTIEVQRPNRVQQMKGVNNSTNHPENVQQMLRQCIENQGWVVEGDRHALG